MRDTLVGDVILLVFVQNNKTQKHYAVHNSPEPVHNMWGFGQRRPQDSLQRNAMTRQTAIKMINRRSLSADLAGEISIHSFLGIVITEYLRNGGDLKTVAHLSVHKSTRATQLYNRVNEELSLDEIERIHIYV